ncbi:MAG: hypothetical protein AAFR16_02870 [Pseudomonadota bacterium]
MWIDGRKEDAETILLFSLLVSAPVFEGVTAESFYAMVAKIEGKLGTPVSDAAEGVVRESVKPLSVKLRETAYVYALRMIFIDRTIHVAEMKAIDDLSVWLEVGHARDKIKEVTAIMANPPNA